MTHRKALRILGIEEKASFAQIKKRYRQLMTAVHPDVTKENRREYSWTAAEINEAYAYLEKWYQNRAFSETESDNAAGNTGSAGTRSVHWKAPENPGAYAPRDVFQQVEDISGASIGKFTVAKGRFLWVIEEEFPLFLLSVFQCAKELLENCDRERYRKAKLRGSVIKDVPEAMRQQYLQELVYLLTQQFIDGEQLLDELAVLEKDTEKGRIYKIPAILEYTGRKTVLPPGTGLLPGRLKNHRLYLKNKEGKELGYLSFPDDRFYYVIIPFFEQRRVQVKIQAEEKTGVQNLTLWVRLPDETKGLPENLSMQIEMLLEKYKA